MTGLLLLIAILATWRVTRLVTRDHVTERPRKWVQARAGERLSYFVTCPWCVSPYVALVTAWAILWWPSNRGVLLVLVALGVSQVVALGQVWLDPPEDEGEIVDDEAQ